MDLTTGIQLASTLGLVIGLLFTGWRVRLSQRQRMREAALQLV